MQARGDEAREVRHVAEEQGSDLVGDLPEAIRLDDARVRRRAAHDQLRPVLLRGAQDLLEVDETGVAVDAVRGDRVEVAGEVDPVPVRQVAAVVEPHGEERVAGLEAGEVHGHVRLRSGVRLHVGVLRAEEGFRPLDREALDIVDDLAPAVVAPPGVPLGVLVGGHRPDGLEHRGPREVLGRDELDLGTLAVELAREESRDLRVDLGQPGGAKRVEGALDHRHPVVV
jgi:hypothetical protein